MNPSPPAEPADTPEATVSTHVLDTARGRPARGVPVALVTRARPDGEWRPHAEGTTDADGRCDDFPPLPDGTVAARLVFSTAPHLAAVGEGDTPFFPEVAVAFAISPAEHHHVPLLLAPHGYTVYRGS
ncbi:hydroxyisourate hydrolase [Streptomyces sp. ST2-7A]|uniref:hydroxyisourate hydrolase n=1 Tax=Streptomyces sp. ST2-7A TaxID=2907214 RepID=UPI001F2A0C52|nr:hydroxyisourate hydrolase [Streptomyces sp. ST2-7A]MCE7082058.1 hydroxyisourate hydrolase [Streptomyces sp. ST2-7A]